MLVGLGVGRRGSVWPVWSCDIWSGLYPRARSDLSGHCRTTVRELLFRRGAV
ncbi:unnamed protein product [[Actinomadura] parvosata subsp. kistnae]|nr:unnamed protein product [Actinomadura parvosata subsp. kistnae]